MTLCPTRHGHREAASPFHQTKPCATQQAPENVYGLLKNTKRSYLHFRPIRPEDWELPEDTMPDNISEVLKKDPRQLDFFENYWYWRVRSEATVLDPENLPRKSYRQLAYDMGMQTISEKNEHLVGLLELYEYLVMAPCVGPFGTLENPVLVPSVSNDRIVACTGGTGDNEHHLLYFRCREGFLYRCGECDQVFMLVRVLYTLPEGLDPFPVDPDVDDVFDTQLLEKGQRLWNIGEYVYWPAGNLAYKRAFMDGEFGNDIPALDGEYLAQIEAASQGAVGNHRAPRLPE